MLHKDIEQAKDLILYFQGKCDIFIHIDKSCKINEKELETIKSLPGVINVYQKYKVHWGGYSILKTEMFLLRQTLKYSDFIYIHLLSGTDYPIKPLSTFLKKFDIPEYEYIESTHLPNPNWQFNTMHRLQYIFLMDFTPVKNDIDIKTIWDRAKKWAKYGIKKRIPDDFPHIYGGSQWFSLTRRCIEELLKYTKKNPKFYRKMRFVFTPDEIYIPTLVMNLDYKDKKIVNDNLRFINWTKFNAPHPSPLKEQDIGNLALGDNFFARKVDYNSFKLKEHINKYLLEEEQATYDQTGICTQKNILNYDFDDELANCIRYLCKVEKIKKVIDLGCGPGYYVNYLRSNKILSYGYDGNPNIEELSSIIMNKTKSPCENIMLHKPIDSYNNGDLVLLLSVGEYINKRYEKTVFDNICNITSKYIIISWADDKKYDSHIINPKGHNELIRELNIRGFTLDPLASQLLKDSAEILQKKHNIYFFKKK